MIHNEVKKVMMLYSSRLNEMFPTEVRGVYLYGSTILEAFHPESSDIDFVTVFSRELTDEELKKLSYLHKQVRAENPLVKKFECEYLSLDEQNQLHLDKSFPFFEGTKCKGERRLMKIAVYQLIHDSYAVYGPNFSTYYSSINRQDIMQEMEYNLNHYIASKASKSYLFLFDSWIEFIVLTLCRVYYTLKTGKITSKELACEEVIKDFDLSYSDILHEALRIRGRDQAKSNYKNRWERKKATIQFINSLREYCNQTFLTR
ncbi:aminoglycoside adenylyltransferase domain-containing protein [Lysinibacillus sp. fls2-241-R2A-57]|uniref:aminoglycoside adenylyltransferase domain-containing protein n=1 Tax=Lysinibacillus sp. fls2-241-R2A-57 TaxID=3040292 RepID=UPI002556F032|nr:aminoglycoside adenylyltransferase domain-containing protein [Lysinibacillus sp. fls2-241-R2A-57]